MMSSSIKSIFIIKYVIFSLICYATTLLAEPQTPRVRALITADTKSNLQLSVAEDLKNMHMLLDALSTIGIPVIKHELQNEGLCVKNITNWIKELPAESNDTLIFYFSGHGFRTSMMKSPFPILALQQGKECIENSRIQKALQKKKARLTIIITDCCNSSFFPKLILQPLTPLKQKNILNKHFTKNIKDIFIRTQGTLTTTAAVKGTNAVGFIPIGGLFTNIFIRNLVLAADKNKKADWKTILSNTRKECKSFKQEPYYEIEIASVQ